MKEFSLRGNSGGRGENTGGNGIKRGIEFFKNGVFTIISERRKNSPYGIKGGEDGEKGENYIIEKNGEKEN